MTLKLLSGTHGGMLNHVRKSLKKFGKVKDINVSKIMKRRGSGHVGEPGDDEGVGIFEQFLFYVV